MTFVKAGIDKYTMTSGISAISVTKATGLTKRWRRWGNRTAEQMKDPAGTLVVNIVRVIDALYRVQVTGAVQ